MVVRCGYLFDSALVGFFAVSLLVSVQSHQPGQQCAKRQADTGACNVVLDAGENLEVDVNNPMDTGSYSAPVMSAKEMQNLTVALSDAPRKLVATLQEFGVAIVTDILSKTEIAEFEEKFKKDLMELIDEGELAKSSEAVQTAYLRVVKEGVSQFPLATANIITEAAGFALRNCLPHGRFAWAVRRHPNVHAAFSAAFHGERDFVTSVDVPFFAPSGQESSTDAPFSAHVDQNMHDCRPGLADCEVYQGALYVWPAEGNHSSTTAVWLGSHREPYKTMMKDEAFKQSGQAGFHYSQIDWMANITSARGLAARWGRHARRLPVPAGALLLWNSRTMHTGWKGGPRLAQAVCLEPRSRRAAAAKISKMRLAALGLPSVHWASLAMQHDMTLSYEGFMSKSGSPVGWLEGPAHPDQVKFPLKPAIRPVGLVENASLDELVKLASVNFEKVGLWRAPPEAAALLEKSIAEEVESFL